MGLNDVVSAERLHISFFGLRNAGKSSLVNAVTGQELSVVSDVKGTTTDPVRKAMELLPLGPVVIIDTPGYDDTGELGELRVKKTKKVLAQTDIAVLVTENTDFLLPVEEELTELFKTRKIPYIIARNKADLLGDPAVANKKSVFGKDNEIYVSALTGDGVYKLKEMIGTLAPDLTGEKLLIADKLNEGDLVVLVIPVDASAPKGRLILPQQMVLRELLDHHMSIAVCQATELKDTLNKLSEKPVLVITDSQAFGSVSKDTPDDILLTSFSILMARYKGNLRQLTEGAAALASIRDGDKVLISEGCTHHRQCEDIGTVKMPKWVRDFAHAEPEFLFTSGGDFPDDLKEYKVVIHCGGCMLNEKEMKHRLEVSEENDVPVVNYGIAIATIHGILKRSLEVFPEMLDILED